MPTYDYRCTACGHTFELFQSMSAKHEKKCPKCGKNALERLIGTGAAVLFKGSGFYQTDYRSEGYKKAADADKPGEAAKDSSSKPDAKPETKAAQSDAKPDAKSESKAAAPSKPEPKSDSKSSSAKTESKPSGTKRAAKP